MTPLRLSVLVLLVPLSAATVTSPLRVMLLPTVEVLLPPLPIWMPLPLKNIGRVTVPGTVIDQAKRVFQTARRWGTTLAAAVLILGVASWVAYSTHRAASPLQSSQSSAKPESASLEQQPVLPTKIVQSVVAAKPRTTLVRRQRGERGNTEVEYIGDDVTVRHFTPRPAPNGILVGSNDVHRIGDDVTVRYFTPKPSIVPAKQPVVR